MLLNMYGVKYLVGGLEHFYIFPYILGRSSQLLLTHIFQRGRSTTKQNKLWDNNIYTEFHAAISFRHFFPTNKIKESNGASNRRFRCHFSLRKGGQWQRALESLRQAPGDSFEISIISPRRPGESLAARNVCNENGHQITARWCPIVS